MNTFDSSKYKDYSLSDVKIERRKQIFSMTLSPSFSDNYMKGLGDLISAFQHNPREVFTKKFKDYTVIGIGYISLMQYEYDIIRYLLKHKPNCQSFEALAYFDFHSVFLIVSNDNSKLIKEFTDFLASKLILKYSASDCLLTFSKATI